MYKTLTAHALKYTMVFLNYYKLLTYITSVCVGYGSWSVTIEIFILNWKEQILIYNTLVESSDHFSGVQKHTMLKNIIEPIPSLLALKNQADQFKTHTDTVMNYEQYSGLLLLAATTHDNKLKWDIKLISKSQRSVYEIW